MFLPCFCLKFYHLPATRCENDAIRNACLSSLTVYRHEKTRRFCCVKTLTVFTGHVMGNRIAIVQRITYDYIIKLRLIRCKPCYEKTGLQGSREIVKYKCYTAVFASSGILYLFVYISKCSSKYLPEFGKMVKPMGNPNPSKISLPYTKPANKTDLFT